MPLATLDLLPSGAEEALVLEVLLEGVDGSLTEDVGDILASGLLDGVGEAVEGDVDGGLFWHNGFDGVNGVNGFDGLAVAVPRPTLDRS